MTIREEFTAFLAKYSISQNKAGSEIGYTGSVVSQWLTGTYKGNLDAVEQAAATWMARESGRRARKIVPIAETETMKRITNAIRIVHEERDIGVVVGAAGTGKTTVLRRYAAENPASCILIEVDSSMNKVSLIQALARALEVEATGNFIDIVRRVTETLSTRDIVVLIDEADYLPGAALELLRRVVNDKGQSGLVLVGLDRLEFQIKGLKNDHSQLASRVGVFLKVEGLKESDAEKIVQSVWPEISKDVTKAFHKYSGASVRLLTKLIDRAHRTAIENRQETPDVDTVVVAGKVILEVRR